MDWNGLRIAPQQPLQRHPSVVGQFEKTFPQGLKPAPILLDLCTG
jgi:hypothetical protein